MKTRLGFSAIHRRPRLQRPPGSDRNGGFSLIELLVVMGLVAVLVGGIGLALRAGGSRGVALQSAQAELAALLGGARGQAILHQTRARLLIYALQPPAGDAAKYLRYLQIVREEPAASGQWLARSDPVYLPLGILVVPPVVSTAQTVAGVNWPVGPFAPLSTLPGPEVISVGGEVFGAAYFVEYQSDGRADPAITKLALATAQPARDACPLFDNPAAVRGLRLRPAGNIGMVNSATGF